MTTLTFLLMGLAAGLLTTLAGQGGGLLLLLVASTVIGPREALVVTAPALVLGNLHRAILLRRFIDRPVALRMIAGTLPGGVLGGLLLGLTPAWMVRVLLVFITLGALAKAFGLLKLAVPLAALFPSGLFIGGLMGTSGGAGILISPILLAAGLSGRVFVATTSSIGVATHIGRVVGYGWLGLFTRELLFASALVTVAIFAGNILGSRLVSHVLKRLSGRQAERAQRAVETAVLVLCVTLSVVGLG